MKKRPKTLEYLMAVTCLVGISTAQADLWVGNDAACDHSTIQSALNDYEAGVDNVMRVANNVSSGIYFENLNIDSTGVGNLVVYGGYDQCQGTLTGIHTEIDGGGSGPVMNIYGSNDFHSITLNNITMSGGSYEPFIERSGGLNVFGGNMNVFLNDVILNHNQGVVGGGMYVEGADVSVYLNRTYILNNTAELGGGLACNEATVLFRNQSAISSNLATNLSGTASGGGVYMYSGCQFSQTAGSDTLAGIGIASNHAINHGGGIYMRGGSTFTAYAQNGEQALIKNNRADSDNNGTGDGGGIYVTGLNTKAEIRQGVLDSNEANNGGAVAVADMGDLRLFQNSTPCFYGQPCTEVINNKAGQQLNSINAGSGGAFYASDQGTMLIMRSQISGNQADTGVVAAVNTGGRISFTSSFVTDNGDLNDSNFNDNYLLVAVDDNSQIDLTNVTVAGNVISTSSDHLALVALGGRFVSEFSILQDDSADILETFNDSGQATFTQFDCSVVHEDQSLSGANFVTDVVTSTALDFIDAAQGEYHIGPASVAVDLCDDAAAWPADVDGHLRGYDDPTVNNVSGPFDAGADETYDSDVIFKNSFE